MSGEQPAAADTVPAGDAGLTLAGLIDVLDRADDPLLPRRLRSRRAVVHRAPSPRAVADRWDPLRESAPHLPVRSGALRGTPSRPRRRSVLLHAVRPAPPPRVPAGAASPAAAGRPAPAPEPLRGLRAGLRSMVRRAALWGAGPGGVHLAWGVAGPRSRFRPDAVTDPVRESALPTEPRPVDRPPVDAPVLLRELPSTPTDRPAAPSPAAAPRPAAPRVERWVLPVPSGRLPARTPGPRGPVPSRARSPGGIRGSPRTAPVRGSPQWWPEPGQSTEAPFSAQPLDAVPRSATPLAGSDSPTSPG